MMEECLILVEADPTLQAPHCDPTMTLYSPPQCSVLFLVFLNQTASVHISWSVDGLHFLGLVFLFPEFVVLCCLLTIEHGTQMPDADK